MQNIFFQLCIIYLQKLSVNGRSIFLMQRSNTIEVTSILGAAIAETWLTDIGHESFPPQGEIKAANPVSACYFCASILRFSVHFSRARPPVFLLWAAVYIWLHSAKLSCRLTKQQIVPRNHDSRLKMLQFSADFLTILMKL